MPKKIAVDNAQVNELLIQALETEMGGVQVYETALRCVQNEELKEEWEKYLEQTRKHVQVMREVCERIGIDPEQETPGRMVVRHIGQSLVKAMEMALQNGEPAAAELVACECVVHAETKDHANWELMNELSKNMTADAAEILAEAVEEVEEEEDEHVYHSAGWCRELWMQSLGMEAVLPPPEEQKHVKTAIGAARAKHQRGEMT
jgi:ferritin-like metal-binding protein YciE